MQQHLIWRSGNVAHKFCEREQSAFLFGWQREEAVLWLATRRMAVAGYIHCCFDFWQKNRLHICVNGDLVFQQAWSRTFPFLNVCLQPLCAQGARLGTRNNSNKFMQCNVILRGVHFAAQVPTSYAPPGFISKWILSFRAMQQYSGYCCYFWQGHGSQCHCPVANLCWSLSQCQFPPCSAAQTALWASLE